MRKALFVVKNVIVFLIGLCVFGVIGGKAEIADRPNPPATGASVVAPEGCRIGAVPENWLAHVESGFPVIHDGRGIAVKSESGEIRRIFGARAFDYAVQQKNWKNIVGPC